MADLGANPHYSESRDAFWDGELAYAPDLILHNGKVVTVDNGFRIAEAVAVKHGRFAAVGCNGPVLALAGARTKQVDLQGKTVIPGLIDAHFRLLDRATAQYYGADLSLKEDISQMLDAVHEAAGRIPAGDVITSNAGWYPHMLREGRPPTREELDQVAPDHLVILRGEFLYLNSLALQRFGINRHTEQPEYGWIEKDPQTGEPTGVLMGDAGMLTRGTHSRFSDAQKKDALRWALMKCAQAGITSIREGGIAVPDLRCYQALHRNSELPIRVSAQLALSMAPPTDEILGHLHRWQLANPLGDEWLRVDRVAYIFADDEYNRMGISAPIQSQLVPEDRVNRYFRDRCCKIDKIERVVTGMARLGLSGGILAGGDRIIGEVLAMLERANAIVDLTSRRWILSQVVYPRKEHHSLMRDLGVVLTPMWHHYYYYPALVTYHGESFAQTMDPFRSLLEADIQVGLGSDLSKIPLNYFVALYYLHTRNTWKWGQVNKEEALPRELALRMLTINNAYVTFEEHVKGSIEPGKLADFLILSDDLLTVPAEQIPDIRPLVTMVGGRVIHQDTNWDMGD